MADSYINIPVPTPTQNPVPSADIRDHVFGGAKIDEFVTSLANTYLDRFGTAHYTIEGLRWLAQQAIAQYGWIPVGTFQAGATLTLPNQILKDTTDGEYYRWDGSLPKTVASGSTPATSGGTGVGAWISVGDSTLRSMLASASGAGMIGYDPSLTYPDETVGNIIENVSDRTLSSSDFASYSATDEGVRVNKGLDYLRSRNTTYSSGGTLRIPRGQHEVNTQILLDRVPSGSADEGDEYILSGDGKGASLLMAGSGFPAGKAIIQSNNPTGNFIQGFQLRNISTRGGNNGVRIETASRTTIDNLKISSSVSDGISIGNSWVNVYSQVITDNCGGHGVNFVNDKQKTSTVTLGGYQLKNAASGWNFGYMNYSSAISPASDQNENHGYRITRATGFVMVAPGSESNGWAGISAEASSVLGANESVLIHGAMMHSNNSKGAGYANLLHAVSANNTKNRIKITDSTAHASLSTTPDIIADGNECVITIDNCVLPNGWESRNGGYIDWVHHSLYVQQTGITGARAVCNLRGTQGQGRNAGADTDSFAGEVTVVASPLAPSTASRRLAVYKLLVSVGLDTGAQCEVIKQLGYVSGNVAGAPSFTWSIGTSHELIATPIGSTAGSFFFEITTDSQVVALKR